MAKQQNAAPDFKAIARDLYQELWDLAEGVTNSVSAIHGDGPRYPRSTESGLRRIKTLNHQAHQVLVEHAPELGIDKSEIPWQQEG